MNEIEKIKCFIKENISYLDYDSLKEIEALLKAEKSSRPEEMYF